MAGLKLASIATQRRQKFFLAGTGAALLLGLILLGFFLLRPKPAERLTINEACESYRTQVEQEAAEYGMSELCGSDTGTYDAGELRYRPDVMQSSEGAYNKLYPQKPNGITDTAYSISCGIQELKYSMEKSRCQKPHGYGAHPSCSPGL